MLTTTELSGKWGKRYQNVIMQPRCGIVRDEGLASSRTTCRAPAAGTAIHWIFRRGLHHATDIRTLFV